MQGAAARRSGRPLLQAAGMAWRGTRSHGSCSRPGPRIPPFGGGDRILARLQEVQGRGSPVRRAPDPAHRHQPAPHPRRLSQGRRGRGASCRSPRGADKEWQVRPGDTHGGRATASWWRPNRPGRRGRMGLPRARITDRLGDPGAPKAVSLIAIHEHGIPDRLSGRRHRGRPIAAKPAGLAGRTDLRDLPLITIDPADARDRGRCRPCPCRRRSEEPRRPCSSGSPSPMSPITCAPGSALDREAKRRGQFHLFPRPGRADAARPAVGRSVQPARGGAARLPSRCAFDGVRGWHAAGSRVSFAALMRSRASLEYAEVQAAQDGAPSGAHGGTCRGHHRGRSTRPTVRCAARGKTVSRWTSTCRSGASS